MTLGPDFGDPVSAADFPATVLRWRHDRAAATVGLERLDDAEWLAAFGRFRPLPDNQPGPLALRYHGHQFRSYNPDLGDGRGFLFAQLREAGTGRLLDLATKGSGQTPWSRRGDGRLTLKGGVREVLAAAMLEALGVPTSRAFSLVETGEALQRNDEPSPTRSAVLTRLSHSHIRFGSFQRHAYFERADLLTLLMEHCIQTYFPHLDAAPDRPAAFLSEIVGRTARLVARWMTAGFVHGVLNTDNMVVTGESFDYGPWRFLPSNDPNFTAAYFDENGLYCFGRQPEAAHWNLQQLAGCLTQIGDEASLVAALNGFSPAYRQALIEAMLNRLGVMSRDADQDLALVNAAFKTLAAGGEAQRWEPFFFDWFGGVASEDRATTGPRANLYQSEDAQHFRNLLADFEPDRPQRLDHPMFSAAEPEELLNEEVEALWTPIAVADDWSALHDKLDRIETARIAWDLAPVPV